MNLFLLEPYELSSAGSAQLSDHRAAHLLQVLKVGTGDTVRIGLLDGPVGAGIVTSAADGTVTLRCDFADAVPPRPAVDLLLALPRPKVLRRLWAQLAALGVGRIMLTNAARVERNYFDTHVLTPACYRPLLVEGLQQARDTRLPVVSIHRRFTALFEDELDGLSGDGTRRLVAQPGAPTTVATCVSRHPAARVLLAVGPEGGWNEHEVGRLEAHGFTPVGMGPRTLRSDTACISLLALVHAAMGADRVQ